MINKLTPLVAKHITGYGNYANDRLKNIRSGDFGATETSKFFIDKPENKQVKKDSRVWLGCSPKDHKLFAERVFYILGSGGIGTNYKDYASYGFLRRALDKTSGLLFPYTPKLSVSHSVDYRQLNIRHSNLAIQQYNMTLPPSLNLDATFTADTPAMAMYMLGALWFLQAVTKCDFGRQSYLLRNKTKGSELTGAIPGAPPPILYLSGFGDMIADSIPVVIKQASWSFPNDKDYVTSMFNLNTMSDYVDIFADNKEFLNGFKIRPNNKNPIHFKRNDIGQDSQGYVFDSKASDFTFTNTLPMSIDVSIQMAVQPNIQEYQDKFSLYKYKTAELLKDFKPYINVVGAKSNSREALNAYKKNLKDSEGKFNSNVHGYTW